MTDLSPEMKAEQAIRIAAAEQERERIIDLIRKGPDGGKSRFINREWLLRQIDKGAS